MNFESFSCMKTLTLPGLALWMTQQRLGGHDYQRLPERKSNLK